MSSSPEDTSHHSPRKADPTKVIVNAIAEHESVEIPQEKTLYDYIEPDALKRLLQHTGEESLSIEFDVEGAAVTVWQDDGVHATVE